MKQHWPNRKILAVCLLMASLTMEGQSLLVKKTIPVAKGWSANSINTVIFRKNALCTYGNCQYIAFYNENGKVVVGKRKSNSRHWQLNVTSFQGQVNDAHNSISIMMDGEGYLHMAWDHHNNKLHYVRSLRPESIEMGQEQPMTGTHEEKLSYPEFYRMPDGDLLFLYRDGRSGQGNLLLKRYRTKTQTWEMVQENLIDGEGKRNAYWQACVDEAGTIHISWVWRSSPDVASNHDLAYARSRDGGVSWEQSNGTRYALPIRAATAEHISRIPPGSNLMNQTSMTTTVDGLPMLAGYWRAINDTVTQYQLMYYDGQKWKRTSLGFRQQDFTLGGAGTKKVPISRPQVISWQHKGINRVMIIYRDEATGSKAMAAVCNDLEKGVWKQETLDPQFLGSWEPTYDTELWRMKKRLDLFLQYTDQVDGEGKSALPPQMIQVLPVRIK